MIIDLENSLIYKGCTLVLLYYRRITTECNNKTLIL